MNHFFALITLVSLLAPAAHARRGEVLCDCIKTWKGGPITYFVGHTVDAGTVVGRDFSKAQRACERKYPTALYSAGLRNCNRQR